MGPLLLLIKPVIGLAKAGLPKAAAGLAHHLLPHLASHLAYERVAETGAGLVAVAELGSASVTVEVVTDTPPSEGPVAEPPKTAEGSAAQELDSWDETIKYTALLVIILTALGRFVSKVGPILIELEKTRVERMKVKLASEESYLKVKKGKNSIELRGRMSNPKVIEEIEKLNERHD